MEKNLCFNRERHEKCSFHKILLIMRLMMFLIMTTFGQLIASQSYSQTARLNLNLKNATVEEVLNRIEESTDFYFLYNKKIIDVERKVNIMAEDRGISEVLDLLFKESKVTYTIVDRQIVLSNNDIEQQQKNVTGKVTDSSAQPLPGVTVTVKGTTNGTTTNIDGNYSLQNVPANATLIFSFVGMMSQEIVIDSRSVINIVLEEDTQSIKEVIVTALGIKRESKALGYAVTHVGGEDLSEAKDHNFINSLAGKVAGVNITHGPSGAGSSSRIVIRGETSLTGNNQPLFVIDGIPLRNETDARSSAGRNLNVDFGNGAAEINPDDIESVTILKGASATALYGSRAAGGVILITSKSGMGGKKGIGVSINSNTSFETVLTGPEYQTLYGQGSNFNFAFHDGYNGGVSDGVDESWGPKLDGRLIAQFDSPTSTGLRGGDVHGIGRILGKAGLDLERRGTITPTPWVSHGSPIDQFFKTGITLSNNISLYGSNDKADFRLSFTNYHNKDIAPNTGMDRNTVSFNASYKLTDKLNISTTGSFVNSFTDNRIEAGYNGESVMYTFLWWGQQINMANMKNYWQAGNEGFQQYNFNYNYHENPYFNQYENTNGMDKNRLYGNITLNYEFSEKLNFMLRSGMDYYNELRTWKRAFSGIIWPKGQYREDNIIFREINTDFLLTYNNTSDSDVQFGASVGGNLMKQKDHFSLLSANQLVIPNVYNFSNTDIPLVSNMEWSEKEIRSLYAMAQASYKNRIFIDITGRNDWSSTLPAGNNSYFYPSVSLSAILTDILDLPEAISFAKLRMGIAQVGNDTRPYNLVDVYGFGQAWGSNLTANESSSIKNANLKPEKSTTYEIGTNLILFDNRLALDFTYYYGINENQILATQLPYSSGYTSTVINAGKISNQGIEALLSGKILRNKDGLNWQSSINFSRDRAVVKELTEGIESYTLTTERVSIIAKPGERMGTMYGTGLVKNPEDGRPVFTNGLSVRSNELRKLGNYNPDFRMGLLNELSYKKVHFSILFDWSQGGNIMSLTRLIGATSGNVVETLWGRDPEHPGPYPGIKQGGITWVDKGTTYTDGIIADGWKAVTANGTTTYVENDVVVHASAYHNTRYNRNNEEEGMYDASYVKLRELKLGYDIPQSLLSKTFISTARISFVGRNLFIWSEFNHGDPETFTNKAGLLIPGIETCSLPTTRSMGFNLNVTF